RFAALPDPGRGQHGTTVHLLPPPVDGSVLAALRVAFDDAAGGGLPAAAPRRPAPTVPLLPPPVDGSVLAALRVAFDDAAAGRLPAAPPLEWYLHSTLDPSLADAAGNNPSALVVEGVP